MTFVPFQHIAFSVTFKNVDAADPRCGIETELTFSGVRYVAAEWDNDPKECAIFHCCDKVCPNAGIVAEFGRIRPLFRTYKLLGTSVPSDQALR